MGAALARAAHETGWPLAALGTRHLERRADLGAELGCPVFDEPDRAAADAGMVLICVPDDAIADVTAQLGDVRGTIIAHCAGARGIEILEPARQRGASVGSLHPVMVLAPGGRGALALQGATAAIDGDEEAAEMLSELARRIGMHPVTIPQEHRVLYHLSAAMVGGLMTGLLAATADLWSHFGLSRQEAAAALGPMVQEAGHNLERLGVPGVVMGPAARGDVGTITRHLSALSEHAPHLAETYRTLVLLCLPYAIESGVLLPAQAAAVRASLDSRA